MSSDLDPDAVSASLRRLSDRVRKKFPAHIAHQHIGDAADALDHRLYDGAVRHLDAAAGSLAPDHLRRLGIKDEGKPGDEPSQRTHAVARRFAEEAHRHLLLVKDLKAGGPGMAFAAEAGAAIELAQAARAQMTI